MTDERNIGQQLDDHRREQQQRNPIINFGDLDLNTSNAPRPRIGSSGPWAAFLVNTGAFLGILAGVVGAFVGQKNMLIGPLYMALTMAPFFLVAWLISRGGSAKAERKPRTAAGVLGAWALIGAAAGVCLGAATPALLGADITAIEGLRVFAPAGLLLGLVIGFFRKPKG